MPPRRSVSDVRAGLVYGLFGTLTSLYAFPTGVLSDYIGIRWSIFIAAVLNGVGRVRPQRSACARVLRGC